MHEYWSLAPTCFEIPYTRVIVLITKSKIETIRGETRVQYSEGIESQLRCIFGPGRGVENDRGPDAPNDKHPAVRREAEHLVTGPSRSVLESTRRIRVKDSSVGGIDPKELTPRADNRETVAVWAISGANRLGRRWYSHQQGFA